MSTDIRPPAETRAAITADGDGVTRNAPVERWVARAVGILFLAAMVTYGAGSGLVTSILNSPDHLADISANSFQFTLGTVLMLANSGVVILIGILMYPVLKPHSQRIAQGYYTARIMEAALLTVGVIALLSLTATSEAYLAAGAPGGSHFETLADVAVRVNDVSYQFGMAALGLGSLFFCYLLFTTRLIPRSVAAWGIVGYAGLLAGAVLEAFGFEVGLLLAVPGGLFEVFVGIWLIAKGFDRPTTAAAVPNR